MSKNTYIYTVVCPICDKHHVFRVNPLEEDKIIICEAKGCREEFCPSGAIVEIEIDKWRPDE